MGAPLTMKLADAELNHCPSEDTLAAFATGVLDISQRGRISEHVNACERCSTVVFSTADSGLPKGRSLDLIQAQETQILALATHTHVPGCAPSDLPSDWELPLQIDEFLLEEIIGQGAMGRVYRARDTELDRVVAVKICSVGDIDQEHRRRIIQEARALARIPNEHVVCCYRAGNYAGSPYIVFEFVDGSSLARGTLPAPWDEVLRLGLQIADGLAAAHKWGVLHRDLKPANVMVGKDGLVKLVDFGLAQVATTSTERDAAKETVMALALLIPAGTPAFLAPELWLGKPASPSSDIYALGALLYNLWTSKPPFVTGDLAALRQMVLTEDPPPLPTQNAVQSELARLLLQCLHKQVDQRPGSAEELSARLQQIQRRRLMDSSASPFDQRTFNRSLRSRLQRTGRFLAMCVVIGLRSDGAEIPVSRCKAPDSFCPSPLSLPSPRLELLGWSAMSATSLRPNELWLVGHSGTPDEYNEQKVKRTGVVLRVYTDGKFSRFEASARFWDVSGFATNGQSHAADALYFGGDAGIYRWGGTQLIQEYGGSVSGLWADAEAGTWAVGSQPDKRPTIVARQTNGSWTSVADDLLAEEQRSLHSIIGTGDHIFASGRGGLLIEIDRRSRRARRIDLPAEVGRAAKLYAQSTNQQGDLFLLASYGEETKSSLIVRYEPSNQTFTIRPVPGRSYFGSWVSPAGPASQQVWLTGSMAAIWRCDLAEPIERAFHRLETGVPSTSSLRTLFGDPRSGLWAVGYDRYTAKTHLLQYRQD